MLISKRQICVLLIDDAFLYIVDIQDWRLAVVWPNVKLLANVLIVSVCAQVQLSLALYDSRRKRVADEDDCLLSGEDAADSASQQLNETSLYDDAAMLKTSIGNYQFWF